ncbi:MAG: alpha-maltose-phosphate synthase [Frankiaceae bacterium]|nr:alpha-maltose-phosphate synthase [Frankiaceae bacterium]
MPPSLSQVRVGLLTREWPPDVYGGAGVHVEFLARELERLVDLRVETFAAHGSWDRLDDANAALKVLSTDLSMAAAVADRDLVHSHTWYANMGGHLAKLLHDVPHVMTSHSLEPLRPWKAEQLGGGYRISSWAEQTAIEAADAVIAVSAGMRADVLSAYPAVDPDRVHVVHNGIDTSLFTPTPDEAMLRGLGLDPGRPVVTYVGRITRQKGLPHLLRAMRAVRRQAQLVLCASAPDTPQIAAEVEAEVNALVGAGFDVLWLRDPLPRNDLVRLLSSSTVFVCPSVYEPLGIVNLEAMACGIPVVASDVGGIPEVVVGGETGVLVPYAAADATAYEAGLATAIDSVLDDPGRARDMGSAGRARAEANFSWTTIAEQTVAIYAAVTALT